MEKTQKKQSKFVRKIKRVWGVPHIRVASCIVCIAIITLTLSFLFDVFKISFWSSIFANLFAGLITGLIICLINGIRQKSISEIEAKKEWLQKLASMLKVYLADYNKLTRLKFDKFNCDENLYIFFYDAHTHANDVNSEILQKQFDKTIDFNPRQYCREKLQYDAEALICLFEDLHFNVEHIDIDCPSSSQIVKYFDTVHKDLKKLNSAIYKELQELKQQLADIQKTVI